MCLHLRPVKAKLLKFKAMKKVSMFAVLFAMFAFVACNNAAEETTESAMDQATEAVEEVVEEVETTTEEVVEEVEAATEEAVDAVEEAAQ